MRRRNIDQQGSKLARITLRLCKDSATIVRDGQISLPSGARNAEAVFNSSHHRHMSVGPAIQLKIPGRNQHERGPALAVRSRQGSEVHVFADRDAP